MNLNEFCEKNSISLSKSVENLCNDGIQQMSVSKDFHHDENHIFRLFILLDEFLFNFPDGFKSKINFNILLPSICWHDVWKSRREQSRNILALFIYELYEGIGSYKIFKKHIRLKKYDKQIDKQTINSISYCIKRHSGFMSLLGVPRVFSGIDSTEGKILRDIDCLESWNYERLEILIEKYSFRIREFNPWLFRFAKLYCFNKLINISDKFFYFDYSHKKYIQISAYFINRIVKLWNNLDELIDVKDKRFVKHLRAPASFKTSDGTKLRDYFLEFENAQKSIS